MSWYEDIVAAHAVANMNVNHYQAVKRDRYAVWQEEDPNDLVAEGRHAERAVRGSTDFFTKAENDPWPALFEQSLTDAGIAWRWNSTQFEPDTGYIHFEWLWEVIDRAEV